MPRRLAPALLSISLVAVVAWPAAPAPQGAPPAMAAAPSVALEAVRFAVIGDNGTANRASVCMRTRSPERGRKG